MKNHGLIGLARTSASLAALPGVIRDAGVTRRQVQVAGGRVASLKMRALVSACAAAFLFAASGNVAMAQDASNQPESKPVTTKQKAGQDETKQKAKPDKQAAAADIQQLDVVRVYGIRQS